jgi:serine acetyltransferase
VWIGLGSIILSGVKVGTGSIIAAGSVVTKDVEPYTIVAGNPAKLIRKRFSNEIINSLEKSEWWNFSDERLKYFAKYFKEPTLFLEELKREKNEK